LVDLILSLFPNVAIPDAVTWTTYRHNMVNHYEPTDNQPSRLDFSYFEYAFENFEDVVTGWEMLILEFAAENYGFRPSGSVIYFYQCDMRKPTGWVSCHGDGFPSNTNFMLDPFYHDPTDPVRLARTMTS
jgi:hypothetical protein